MPPATPAGPPGTPNIDLAEVDRLVARLEQDLAGVHQGSQDVQALRDEVDALRAVLDKDAPPPSEVGDQLRSIHGMMDRAIDTVIDDTLKVAQYVREIARILGL